MPSGEVRRIAAEEAELYKDIRLEMLRLNPESFGEAHGDALKKEIEFYEDRLKGGYVAGCFKDGKIVATAGVYEPLENKKRHKAVLWGVYTTPEYRGQGIGRALCKNALDNVSEAIELIQLSVVKGKDTALGLYKDLGFKEYGLEEKALKIDGQYYDEILMVKFLK